MKVLLAHSGASWSTADVFSGVSYGLRQLGVQVVVYRLDERLEASHRSLHVQWRQKRRADAALEKPTMGDVYYHAGIWSLEMALRHQVDVVLVVSGMFMHPDVLVRLKQAGLRVTLLLTESPYDQAQELRAAALVDGCWTNERTMLPALRAVNPRSGYLPHAWNPEVHRPDAPLPPDVPAYDVVFVGSGFPERVTWFNAIDWTGINLGLYGAWKDLGLKPSVEACIRGDQVQNWYASALYRRAAVGLNLYRTARAWGDPVGVDLAESLSPRAYELAACGVFHLSEARAEVPEVFGDLVPTFRTPAEASVLIRRWLADAESRESIARQLPARVAEQSWVDRARVVLGDLHGLMAQGQAAERRGEDRYAGVCRS